MDPAVARFIEALARSAARRDLREAGQLTKSKRDRRQNATGAEQTQT